MKYQSVENINDLLVAHKTRRGGCKKCCFNDWADACYRLTCQDAHGHTVYWTLSHGRKSDVPFIWDDYMRECVQIKSLCLAKIAELYKTR